MQGESGAGPEPRELTPAEARALAFLRHVSRIPAPVRESLRSSSVIHRFVDPDARRAAQLQAGFWHVPTRRLRPGLLATGAELPRDFTATSVGPLHDHHVYVGRVGDRVARRVAAALHHAMIEEAGYLASPMEVEPDALAVRTDHRVYLVVTRDRRAVGFAGVGLASGLILECRADRSGPLKAECRFGPIPAGRRMIEVEALWVAGGFRGRGLAADLLRLVAGTFGLHPRDLAYRSTFTAGGYASVRRAAGPHFVVAGEVLRLELPFGEPGDVLDPHAVIDATGNSIQAGARP